jgi:microcystin degradation protein MlrC
MSQALIRFVSRVLVASLIWLPLQAQAGLIATDRTVAAAAAQAGQGAAARAAIAAQLENLGVPGDQARERVAALTDEEAASLAARVADAPAGAGAEIAIILIIAFLIWRFGFSDQAKAERSKK